MASSGSAIERWSGVPKEHRAERCTDAAAGMQEALLRRYECCGYKQARVNGHGTQGAVTAGEREHAALWECAEIYRWIVCEQWL